MADESLTTLARLQLLFEHYRESFTHQREYLGKRDRLFVYALFSALGLAFRATTGTGSDGLVVLALDKQIGSSAGIDRDFLAVLLAFVFFAIVSRYFQSTVTVERGYKYLERIERTIETLYGSDIHSRESKSYLRHYPALSNWMHFIYAWIFPAAVFTVTIWNCVAEYNRPGHLIAKLLVWGIGIAMSGIVGLFMYWMKFQKDDPRSPPQGEIVAGAPPQT